MKLSGNTISDVIAHFLADEAGNWSVGRGEDYAFITNNDGRTSLFLRVRKEIRLLAYKTRRENSFWLARSGRTERIVTDFILYFPLGPSLLEDYNRGDISLHIPICVTYDDVSRDWYYRDRKNNFIRR